MRDQSSCREPESLREILMHTAAGISHFLLLRFLTFSPSLLSSPR